MSSYRELLMDTVNRANERFMRTFAGVSVAQANGFPVADRAPQIKSMAWLAWHTARELDFQIAALAGTGPLWHSQGWRERFPFTVADDERDWQHSLAQAQRIQSDSNEALLDYLQAATAATVAYISGLAERDLDAISMKVGRRRLAAPCAWFPSLMTPLCTRARCSTPGAC